MKKIVLPALVAAMLLLGGCNTGNTSTDTQTGPIDGSSAGESAVLEEGIVIPEADIPLEEGQAAPDDRIAGLTQNEYSGIEMTAEALENKSILPGSGFTVTVTIKNTGDQTIHFTQGSGSFTTPQAVFVEVEGLQPVLPKDQLGPATMDMVTAELGPGEEKKYDLRVLATAPNQDFERYVYDSYNSDGSYLGDMEWPDIQAMFPAIAQAPVGSYEGHAYLLYSVEQGDENPNFYGEPTGYARADFTIDINE